MATVAVLGLGAMGGRMAASLLKAGHTVAVWNRDAAKAEPLVAMGARAAATPREAARDAAFVIAMVRDDEASRRVWLAEDDGALAGAADEAVAIDSSTLTPAWTRALAGHAAARGIAFLDAPVAGSRPQAEAGQLIYLVGGEAAALAKAEPILKAMGAAIHHAGPSGSGTVVKLAINALFGIQVAALGELIGMMQASGVDVAKAVEIIGATPVCSPAAKGAAASMLARSFAPMFPVELVEKDFGYVVEAARASGARVPMAEAAKTVMVEAVARGFGDRNLTSLVELYKNKPDYP